MLNNLINRIKKHYQVLNLIEISRSRLLKNSQLLSSESLLQIAPVLKSNAYGHGIAEVAQILDTQNFPFLCVDSLYEAYQIHKPLLPAFISRVKAKTPILIMGYTNPENLKWKKLPFHFAVWDLNLAEILNRHQAGASVHIFVDTGMNREGVPLTELKSFLQKISQFKNINVVGLMSHLASATSIDDPLFKNQFENYKLAKEIATEVGLKLRWYHLGGSSLLFDKNLTAKVSGVVNVLRSGRAIYGIGMSPRSLLQPVFKLKTQIVEVKKIKKGQLVGYDGTFKAASDMTIAILPIGYYDGLDRRLSNKGIVKIKNQFAPIVGLISMNMSTVDVSRIDHPKVGDSVIVYSDEMKDKNSALEASRICQTTPSEILSSLTPSTRRIIVD